VSEDDVSARLGSSLYGSTGSFGTMEMELPARLGYPSISGLLISSSSQFCTLIETRYLRSLGHPRLQDIWASAGRLGGRNIELKRRIYC
jgi:hypothetical protein